MTSTVVLVTGSRWTGIFDPIRRPGVTLEQAREERLWVDRMLMAETHGMFIHRLYEGDAPGVDRLAGVWADSFRIQVERRPADWRKVSECKECRHPSAGAGPCRNGRMVAEAKAMADDLGCDIVCLEFPGGAGTADCVRRARAAGIQVREIAK